jgi:hypothetical protein
MTYAGISLNKTKSRLGPLPPSANWFFPPTKRVSFYALSSPLSQTENEISGSATTPFWPSLYYFELFY